MADQVFNVHHGALEDLFFQKDQDTRANIQAAAKDSKAVESLKLVSGIENGAVLEKMVAMGIKSDTLTALSVVPLIRVAWADGHLDDKERKAILAGAEAAGIYAGSHGYLLLDKWMESQPPQALYDTWSDYIRTLKDNLAEGELSVLREKMLGRARKVAESSGGFTKKGATSNEETSALSAMDAVFAS